MNSRGYAVLIVTWALASAFIICVLAVSICALCGRVIEKEMLTWLKEVSLTCGAALTGLIARTSSAEPPPPVQPVTVVNAPNDPVPTHDANPQPAAKIGDKEAK